MERLSLMLSIAPERPPDFNQTRGTEETPKKLNGCATGQQGVSNALYLKSSTGMPIVKLSENTLEFPIVRIQGNQWLLQHKPK